MANANKPNLPALFGKGSLTLEVEGCFLLDDEADILMEKNGVKTRDQLLTLIMLIRSFGERRMVKQLLVASVQRLLLGKEELVTLYRMQTKEARIRGTFITLTDLWDIQSLAFRDKNHHAAIAHWFSQEEIVAIAEEVKEVSHADLVTFFQHWFYGSAHPVLLGKDFLEYWYARTGETYGGDVDGKIASLIAIALYDKDPGAVKLDGVLERFDSLSMRDSDSHGIYRYLGLAFDIAGNNKKKRKKVLDAWVGRIIAMICGGRSLFRGAQLSIEILIREKGIPEREKKQALKKIDETAKSVAESYTNLVKEAEEMVNAI